MDRSLPVGYIRRRRARGIVIASASVAGVAILLILATAMLRPSVRRDRIRTARVTRGPIEATVSASGTVVPLYAQVVGSPIDTHVVRRLVAPGDTVAPGDPLVLLDVGATELALQRLDDQIALRRNDSERARLELADRNGELQARRAVKALEVKNAEYEADRNRQYYERGMFSLDEVRAAETQAERARIELARLDQALVDGGQLHDAQLKGHALELAILDKDRQETAQLLRDARPTADRGGVVTWVVENEGAAVHRGDAIARLADLSAFRVEATLSDVHSARVHTRQPVIVTAGAARLGGRVEAVRPTVENGLLTLEISLDEPGAPALRNHQRVDANIVTDRHDNALIVPRGAFLNLDGRTAVFVVRGRAAHRAFVELGLANYESYEIVAGLSEGDEIILSDLSDQRNAKEVALR